MELLKLIGVLVMFQFLIGTLKTCLLAFYYFGAINVSIPHRYAKNGIQVQILLYFVLSFNSS